MIALIVTIAKIATIDDMIAMIARRIASWATILGRKNFVPLVLAMRIWQHLWQQLWHEILYHDNNCDEDEEEEDDEDCRMALSCSLCNLCISSGFPEKKQIDINVSFLLQENLAAKTARSVEKPRKAVPDMTLPR